MSKTTAITIQLMLVVVAVLATLLIGTTTTHYVLDLAVLRLLNTWLVQCARARTPLARNRPSRQKEERTTD